MSTEAREYDPEVNNRAREDEARGRDSEAWSAEDFFPIQHVLVPPKAIPDYFFNFWSSL